MLEHYLSLSNVSLLNSTTTVPDMEESLKRVLLVWAWGPSIITGKEKVKYARGAKLYEREIELFNLGNNCARQVIEAAFEANVVGISNMEKDVDMQGNQTWLLGR